MHDDTFDEWTSFIGEQAMSIKTKMLLAAALDILDYDNIPANLQTASVIITAINMRLSMLEYDYGVGRPMEVDCAQCGEPHTHSREGLVEFLRDAALLLSAVVNNDRDTAEALQQLFEAEKGS
jgi:hypothetical protein